MFDLRYLTPEEANELVGKFGWDFTQPWRVPLHWIRLLDGWLLEYCENVGQDVTLWQIDVNNGRTRHRGGGEGDCFSEWEGP